MKRILAALAVVIVVAGVWLYASPWWTLRQMRDAAEARDAEQLSRYIDYEALRADLKSDLRRSMMSQMDKTDGNQGFEALGAAFAMALLDPMVEAMVTPEGLQAMFANQAATRTGEGKPEMPVQPAEDPVIERTGFDEFKVRGRDGEGAFVFRRDGLGWKMVGMDIPTA